MTALASFLLGGKLGASAAQKDFDMKSKYLSFLNLMHPFRMASEISAKISDKQYQNAKCSADLSASVYYQEIRTCLADAECGSLIIDDVKEMAPEMLDDNKKFTYYENGEACHLTSPPK